MKTSQSLGNAFVGHDTSWRNLYRTVGICALLFVVFNLLAIVLDLRAPSLVADADSRRLF